MMFLSKSSGETRDRVQPCLLLLPLPAVKKMIQTALIQNAHADLVTDATYDMYGLMLATCGLDQR